MFPPMRRSRQELTEQACVQILERGTSGVLALVDGEGYPYAVPLSYLYDGKRIVFHSARSGHKLDALACGDRASFCVIDSDEVVPERYTTYFRSVIVFGRLHVIEDEEARLAALEALALRYAPDDVEGCKKEARDQLVRTVMLELEIEHMSGKQAIELVRAQVSDDASR